MRIILIIALGIFIARIIEAVLPHFDPQSLVPPVVLIATILFLQPLLASPSHSLSATAVLTLLRSHCGKALVLMSALTCTYGVHHASTTVKSSIRR